MKLSKRRMYSQISTMYWLYIAVATAILAGCTPCRNAQERSVWTFHCNDGKCEKATLIEGANGQSLSKCKALCDPNALLWPLPNGPFTVNKTFASVNSNQVTVEGVGLDVKVKTLLEHATVRFQKLLTDAAARANIPPERKAVALHVDVKIEDDTVTTMAIDVDESYVLRVTPEDDTRIVATITAPTFFGARHALETLAQLTISDDLDGNLLLFNDVNIIDSPVFHYRGLNLDTARNYMTVNAIKRTLEGMAINKLNTFHWHITDSHSWPFVSDSFPQLSRYGAYSPKQVYTPADIRGIVEYGRVRGVRVVPELDAPAHVGEGFQWAEPNTVVCFKAQPWTKYCVEPPCGQFNPTKEQVYTILSGVYADMLRVFDSDIFHMGGDEVSTDCWNSSEPVLQGMAELGYAPDKEGFIKLWDYFQRRALEKLVEANGGKNLPVILWTSGLTEHGNYKYLDKDTYIIEIWTKGNDPHIAELVNAGYRVIFSNYEALYLDCGYGAWVTEGNNWCSPYIGWQKVYDNSPYKMLGALNVDPEEARRLAMGAEASLWTEQVDDVTLDNRLWPRLAAMAERLWSDPKQEWRQAEARMLNHRQRLLNHGFYPERLQPQWCYQNEGECPI